MTEASPDAALLEAFEATWPAAEVARQGGLETGRGLGAGGRVSSTRAVGDWDPWDLDAAVAQHRAWGQPPLARAWDGDGFARHLDACPGWRRVEPTALLAAPVAALGAPPLPPMTAITVAWPPLALQRDLWAAGGIGAARQAVMARTAGPKVCLLGRVKDRPGAAGFVALHAGVAFLHALHVAPELRRNGLGAALMRKTAVWARARGADRLALAVGLGNTAALALYGGLGFAKAGRYAYWQWD